MTGDEKDVGSDTAPETKGAQSAGLTGYIVRTTLFPLVHGATDRPDSVPSNTPTKAAGCFTRYRSSLLLVPVQLSR